MTSARFRRPASLSPAKADQIPGDVDPATRIELAHETAAAFLGGTKGAADVQLSGRIIDLIDAGGLADLSQLWRSCAANTLPGILALLVELREEVKRNTQGAAVSYSDGATTAQVHDAVAGVANPTGPNEIRVMLDALFSGAFAGDFGVALDRAAAFCHVWAVGTTFDADRADAHSDAHATQVTQRAAHIDRWAAAFEQAGRLWRAGLLD